MTTLDCLAPRRVAVFWSALLRRPLAAHANGWVFRGERDDDHPRILFQPVPEPKG